MVYKKIMFCFMFTAILSIKAVEASTTVAYICEVTGAFGVHADSFNIGSDITVEYTIDESVIDTNSSPGEGIFTNAIKSLAVRTKSLHILTARGSYGNIQTFDNTADSRSGKLSDQVFIFGGKISPKSIVGGETVISAEVDFLSEFVSPPDEPTMLSSDAIPVVRLPTNDATLFLLTNAGFTQIDFALRVFAIKGTTPWGTRHSVTCNNITTNATVRIPQTNASDWDCEQAGLPIKSGDKVKVIIEGIKY